jgi:hypothetical protein
VTTTRKEEHMELEELVNAIYGLNAEEDVSTVYRACAERAKQLRARRAATISATLKIGDRVRLSDDIRPRRYGGVVGSVRGRRASKWEVQLLSTGEQLIVGASALTRLEDP